MHPPPSSLGVVKSLLGGGVRNVYFGGRGYIVGGRVNLFCLGQGGHIILK